MNADRWLRIVTNMASRHGARPTAMGLCVTCVDVLDVSGAGITIFGSAPAPGPLCASDARMRALGELELGLGDGPSREAFTTGNVVVEPDLVGTPPTRWIGFADAAVRLGVHAVFAVPLLVGAARLGAMTLYRDRAGELTSDQRADALVLAAIITRVVLGMQARLPAGAVLAEQGEPRSFHTVVHQATGMVAAQLDIDIADALARIQALAFGADRTVTAVATDVVARRLRFGR